jgi:hypothetical protein
MKRQLFLVLACLGAGAGILHGQTPGPETRAQPPGDLVLTGIVEVPGDRQGAAPIKSVFLQVGAGSTARLYSFRERQKIDAIEVLTIDTLRGKVKLRYREQVLELSFEAQQAERALEQEKDASHTSYHTERSKLDRARDDAERRKAEQTPGITHSR